jgi:diaminopropionate ammonia-lyase
MPEEKPIDWVLNERARSMARSPAVAELFPPGTFRLARALHCQLPGYHISPLKNLPRLAAMIGLGGIWVKDESARLSLNSFKVLGGSFAIYRYLASRLGAEDRQPSFAELTAEAVRPRLGEITFAAATDGNHGRGVAWSATQLGFRSVIYVHRLTSQNRIRSIEKNGARVVVVDGTYDDAVRQVDEDAAAHGWQVVSDTSWKGYTDIPLWVMQGYTTMLSEAQEQFAAQGIIRPTHVLVQAGVGSLAAATIGFYAEVFGPDRPWTVVVEPTKAACLFASAEAGDGQPRAVGGDLDTIMAGLACGEPNPLAWRILWDCADVFARCPDYVAAKGMRVYGVPLAGDPFIVSGESGAVTLGALLFILQRPEYAPLRDLLGLGPDSQVLLINSEGNTDPDEFRRVVWEGGDPVPDPYQQFRR